MARASGGANNMHPLNWGGGGGGGHKRFGFSFGLTIALVLARD